MFSARVPFYAQPAAAPGGFGNNAFFPNIAGQWLSTISSTQLITWKATTGYTIEYWIRLNAFPGTINPGPGNQDAGGTNYWSFGPAETGRLEFYFWGPGTNTVRTATNTLALNTWYNICMVATTTGTTTTMSLYVNGTRQQIQLNAGAFGNTVTITNGAVATGTPFRMGTYGANRWNAYMDNLRVSNINRYSGASYSVATAPFTSDANTQLLLICNGTPGSATFTDSSGFGRAILNSGNLVTISSTYANHS